MRLTPILPLLLAAATAAAAAPRPVLHHEASVSLNVAEHEVSVSDVITVPAGVDTLWLDAAFRLVSWSRPGPAGSRDAQRLFPVQAEPIAPADSLVPFATWVGEAPTEPFEVKLRYAARLLESTDDVTFSRENVGREIRGTVGEEGVYLACEGWLPFHPDAMATHRLTVRSPEGWLPVTQGARVRSAVENGLQVTEWEAWKPADGLILIANRYHVTERDFGGVTSYTYFLEDDPALAETYQERTGAYLAMYDEMIGPYPYAKFATVENWFPTGYGMPSWTLLGGTVLRLPFIPYTSFGHEIAHNWWGNSAFVDDEGGNWCEGLTVYCADYHYKVLEGDAAAAEYRKNLLKDFVAYVREGRDMPLREFRERHSGSTRAIGYGKSMMVFHMVERRIGREAFLAALRDVWSGHMFQPVSWDDFFTAFSAHGGEDLTWLRDQWLDRPGAPVLRLESAVRDGGRVRVTLSQDEPAWRLDVPVVVDGPGGPVEHVVHLDGPRGEFTLEAPGAVAVHVDPDDHVFRRLHAAEIEPTLSQVFGEESPLFLADGEAGRGFAAGWMEDAPADVAAMGAAADGRARVLLEAPAAELNRWLPAGVQAAGGLLFLEGKRLDLKTHTVVMAVKDPDQPDVTSLLVVGGDAAALPGLADRISHYGKYSWLVFPPRGRPERGNWDTADSPLSAALNRGE